MADFHRPPFRRSQTEYIPVTVLNEAANHRHGLHFAVASNKRTNEDVSSTSTPHVIALVGLPARGKTYISRKLHRYLNWIGVATRVINLGDYRRKFATYASHEVFSPDNPTGVRIRQAVCDQGLNDALHFLEHEGGEVVVFDATNTTRERRSLLHERVVREKGFKLFFVESICDDEAIVESNIRSVKVTSPDYVDFEDHEKVVEDFKKRIKHYEKFYETIDEYQESQFSFMKIFNAGQKVLVHKHEGHIQSRVVYYLMNIKITPRTIYLSRHGEAEFNVQGRLGGDSGLTERGRQYSRLLAHHMNCLEIDKLLVWTSFMQRTVDTAEHVVGIHERWKTLNELDVGICDGLTYEQVKLNYPDDFEARDRDKYSYRYPRGESYEDLVARLEPVIMELERHGSVLVIAHQAVLRCILSYFMEVDEEELPYLEVPMHTLFTLEPRAYGCNLQTTRFPVEAVSTHRQRPSQPGLLEDRFRRRSKPLVVNDVQAGILMTEQPVMVSTETTA